MISAPKIPNMETSCVDLLFRHVIRKSYVAVKCYGDFSVVSRISASGSHLCDVKFSMLTLQNKVNGLDFFGKIVYILVYFVNTCK